MTERDKRTISKIELLKLKGLVKSIIFLKNQNEALEYSLMGTGIDYAKDHVQTSPVNMMESAMAQFYDNSKKIDALYNNAVTYIKKIKKINNSLYENILIDIFINDKSFGQIAKEQNRERSNIQYLYKKSLICYYDHNI